MMTDVDERASPPPDREGEAQRDARMVEALSRRVGELTAQLKAARAAHGEFVSLMSHELRTPLNAMIGFSELLLGTQQNAPQRKWIENVYQCGCNLVVLVNDMADLSKMTAGVDESAQADFALPEVVGESVETVRPEAEAKGIGMRTVVDPLVACHFLGDAPRLRQLLVNLLRHAVRFSRAGGEIAFAVARRPADLAGDEHELPVAVHQPPGTQILFTVRNADAAIPPEQLAVIFEPFKLLRTPEGKHEGTGLKLAICRAAVAKMGGVIWAECARGGGSVFTCAIPFHRVESSSTLYNERGPI